ncbi:MAG: hypothetical protein LUD16_11735 [Lachnospiraceae bacterium]|nr:hypothetical protein [Lachnospiraceae bacterium]
MKRIKYLVFFLSICGVFCFPVWAGASGDGTGSVTLQGLPSEATGVTMTLYEVATGSGDSFTCSGAFASSGIEIPSMNDADGLEKAAEQLVSYAEENAIEGVSLQVSSEGTLTFANLSSALYLIVQSSGTDAIMIQKLFVPIPYLDELTGETSYQARLTPKYTIPTGTVLLTKVDDSGAVVAGAVFDLQMKTYITDSGVVPERAIVYQDGSGKYIWKDIETDLITDENGQIEVSSLTSGIYQFVETSVPEGFVQTLATAYFVIDTDGTATQTADEGETTADTENAGKAKAAAADAGTGTENTGTEGTETGNAATDSETVQTLTVENVRTSLTIYKVDEDGNALAGAELVIKDADGNVITNADGTVKYSLTTTAEPTVLYQIPAGTYYLSEVSAPIGYAIAEDVKFTVDDTAGVVNTVSMEDPKETDSLGEEPTEKATESQTEEPTEKVTEPQTEGQTQTEPQTEMLTETQTEPETETETETESESEMESESESESESGSEAESERENESEPASESLTEADLENQSEQETETEKRIQMTVSVSKLDESTGEPLAGAVLRVVDSDGRIVEEWTSDGSAHTFTASLREGETCQLIEVSAPEGYGIAGNQSFTAVDGGTAELTMSDPKHEVEEEKEVAVSVTKTLIYANGEAVQSRIGAVNETFYVALYSDESCTQRVSGILALNYSYADASTVTFTGLDAGETYYVSECDANGNAIVTGTVSDNTLFYADFENGNAVMVEEGGESAALGFENEFYSLPSEFYMEAELTITKRLLGADGQALSDDAVFYAGVFADPDYTTLSDKVTYNIVELDMAGRSEVSVSVYVALDESEPVTLYITEVDEDGNPVAEDTDFLYTVSVDNSSVTVSESVMSASVTITNQKIETGYEEQSSGGSSAETNGSANAAAETETASVKTGDDTPLGRYGSLLLAAVVLLLGSGAYRRRDRKERRW